MARRWLFLLVFLCLGLLIASKNTYAVGFYHLEDFETGWIGDYAPGWSNMDYEWGDPPGSIMEQVVDPLDAINKVMKLSLTGPGDPDSYSSWFGGVAFDNFWPEAYMHRDYSPWVKVEFYDTRNGEVGTGNYLPSGALASVSRSELHGWGNPYDINVDWTDLQHGTRHGDASADARTYYHYGSAPEHGGSGWTATSIYRTEGWHSAEMRLSPTGQLDYYIDGIFVGSSPRTDYLELTSFMLYVWREDYALGDDTCVLFDNFEVGSTIPEPASLILLGSGLLGLAGFRRKFKKS